MLEGLRALDEAWRLPEPFSAPRGRRHGPFAFRVQPFLAFQWAPQAMAKETSEAKYQNFSDSGMREPRLCHRGPGWARYFQFSWGLLSSEFT